MPSALAAAIRNRIADDTAAVEQEYRGLIQHAADGDVDTDAAAAFFLANPAYTLDAFDSEVNVIVAARERARDRREAAAKLKDFDHRAARKAVDVAERALADLDREREAWLAAFIAKRTAAEKVLADANDAAGEPERLTWFLTHSADPAKRARLAALPGWIREAENRIAALKQQLPALEKVANQRSLQPDEMLREERTGYRSSPAEVERDKSYAAKRAAKIREEITGAEFTLQGFREELESLPAELLVP